MVKEKVVVGMSGGVDSSVAAYLLKKEGYEVIGVTMKLWQHNGGMENAEKNSVHSAIDDAKKVSDMLGIQHYVVDFENEFKSKVVDYFINEYVNGKTPNPCIVCNRYVKWEAMLAVCENFGADFIATGHYGKIERFPATGRFSIKNCDIQNKDQTYALYSLTQEQLSKTIMPLGTYGKHDVRKIAREIGLAVADKPDSMEICFISDDNYGRFIEKSLDKRMVSGNFVDMDGNFIGKHKGIVNYTIGQRKGLGVSFGKPMFVYEIRPEKNEIVLCENEDLFKKTVFAKNINFMAFETIEGEIEAEAKIRYNHKKSKCRVSIINGDTIKCEFEQPQRAATPGQALVVYDGEYIICGGTII